MEEYSENMVLKKFSRFYDYDSEGALISNEMHNGDWPVWFVIRTYCHEGTFFQTEFGSKYTIELHAVSPQAAGLRECIQAHKSSGATRRTFSDLSKEKRQLALIEMLIQYGVSVCLHQESGNNFRKVMKEVKLEAKKATMLFGFYMDRRCNGFGDTGWQFISGDIAHTKARRREKWKVKDCRRMLKII
jgi:hypothetical protein